MRVFVDGPELKKQGIFGLGAIYVGQGSTIVKSKKLYNQAMISVNVYAEIAAVEFALTQLEKVMGNEFSQPLKILLYSDWNEVEKLQDILLMTKRIPAINAIAEKINKGKKQFLSTYPEVELDITYISKEEKRYNPYYIGAHNAARHAIGIKSR